MAVVIIQKTMDLCLYEIFRSFFDLQLEGYSCARRKRLNEKRLGFRQGKSTAEPLFCVRRPTDVYGQSNDPLFLQFSLVLEEAFYKIDQK